MFAMVEEGIEILHGGAHGAYEADGVWIGCVTQIN